MARRKHYYNWEQLLKSGYDKTVDFFTEQGWPYESAELFAMKIEDYNDDAAGQKLGDAWYDQDTMETAAYYVDSDYQHMIDKVTDDWNVRYGDSGYQPKYSEEERYEARQALPYHGYSQEDIIKVSDTQYIYANNFAFGEAPSKKMIEKTTAALDTEIETTAEKKVNTTAATTAAAKTNQKDVYIDGVHYNSYQEAAEATGMSTKTIQRNIDDGKTHKGHLITSTANDTQNYWTNRAAADQQLIDRNELAAEKAVQQIQHDSYEKMAAELNDFYSKLEDGYTPTRSELVRMEQYQSLCSNIKENMDDATKSSLTIIQGSLEETAATKMTGYDRYGIEAVANTQYKGEYYSDRVWNNSNDAAAKIQEKVTDCIISGESLDKAKQELKEQCNGNTYNAMRVLRTETARVQNKAEIAMYGNAGIKEVEILVEPDACELCSQYKGKTFMLGHQPSLPIHPNCRCDLLPVVK